MAQQDRTHRRQRITRYVGERLEAETAERGALAKIAKATGFTAAHLSNVKTSKTRGVGDDLLRALADYWGITPEDLEREALAKIPAPDETPEPYPNRAIVMESPEFEGASARVKEMFTSLRGDDGRDKSVVQWSIALAKLIEYEALGILETRGGTPIKSTR